MAIHESLRRSPFYSEGERTPSHRTQINLRHFTEKENGSGEFVGPPSHHTKGARPFAASPHGLNVIRAKYRCDSYRMREYESEMEAMEMQDGTDEAVVVPRVEDHPIHERLKVFVALENSRMRFRDRNENRKKSFVSDVESVWNADRERADGSNSERGGDSEESIYNNCQIQSVDPSEATRKFASIRPSAESPEFASNCHSERKDSRLHCLTPPFSPPELQTLVVDEKISLSGVDGAEVMIISVVRRCTTEGSSRDENPDSVACWNVQAYDPSDGTTRCLILREDHYLFRKLLSKGASLGPNEENQIWTPVFEHEILVDDASGEYYNTKIPCLCSIFVGNTDHYITARIRLQSTSNKRTGDFEIKKDILVCEILARLDEQLSYSALDTEFWNSNGNEVIWSDLLKQTELRRGSVESNGERGWALSFHEPLEPPVTKSLLQNISLAHNLVRNLCLEEDDTGILLSFRGDSWELNQCVTRRGNDPVDWLRDAEEKIPSLSMRVASSPEILNSSRICPCCANTGPKGPWLGFYQCVYESVASNVITSLQSTKVIDQSNEKTRAASIFSKDGTEEIVGTMRVQTVLALEIPILSSTMVSDDKSITVPPPSKHEMTNGIIPQNFGQCVDLLQNPAEFELSTRVPPTILILDPCAVCESDWKCASRCDNPNVRHRRDMGDIDENSFRVRCWAHRVEPDSTIPRFVFGVTERGARPNMTGVEHSDIAHSSSCCLKLFGKRRTPLDYKYVAEHKCTNRDKGHRNQPYIFTVFMNSYKMDSVCRTSLDSSQEDRLMDKREREDKYRKEELKRKICIASLTIEKRREEERIRVEGEASKDILRKHRNKGKAIGEQIVDELWHKRMDRSMVLAWQEIGSSNWERRLDPHNGNIFYHNKDATLPPKMANQWEIPENWEERKDEVEHGANKEDVEIEEKSGDHDEKNFLIHDRKENHMADDKNVDKSNKGSMDEMVDLLVNNNEFMKKIAFKLGVSEDNIRAICLDNPPELRKMEEEDKHSNDVTWNNGASGKTLDAEGSSCTSELVFSQDDSFFASDKAPKKSKLSITRERKNVTVMVPKLNLPLTLTTERNCPPMDSLQSHANIRGYGWRRIPRARIGADFFQHNKRKVAKATFANDSLFNQVNTGKILKIVKPSGKNATTYQLDEQPFHTPYESMMVRDVIADMDRIERVKDIRQKKEDIILNCPDAVALKRMLRVQPREYTTVEEELAREEDELDAIFPKSTDSSSWGKRDINNYDREEDHGQRSIISVKNSNLDVLEEMLDDYGVPVDTMDEYGNTLLILACQQGSKKMAKFLLRRGADINMQNHLGNSVLHYLYEYGQESLGKYMVSKGANDGLLNANGLTCYEGMDLKKVEML